MSTTKGPVCLTYDEYLLIMCMLGVEEIQETFIDSKDNLSAEDINNLWKVCQRSLSEKGYLSNDDEQTIKLDVYALLQACALAEKKINVQVSLTQKTMFDITYFLSKNMVVCVKNNTELSNLNIYFSSKKDLIKKIVECIPDYQNTVEENEDDVISLSTTEYISILSKLNLNEVDGVKKDFLKDIANEKADSLISALKKASGMISISVYLENDAENYNVLIGENTYWSVYATSEDAVSFKEIDSQDIRTLITDIFDYSAGGV